MGKIKITRVPVNLVDEVLNKHETKRIINQYARKGGIVRCGPSQKEIQRGDGRNNNQLKVIYDNQELAEAARKALESVGDASPLYAYPCRYSKHGHWHLATRKPD